MTDLKDTPPSRARGSSKPSAPEVTPANDHLERLLAQLSKIADSVTKLTDSESVTKLTDGQPEALETDPATEERRKALFAYNFLGEALGRQGFAVPRAEVYRSSAVVGGQTITTLLFDQLGQGTTARVRASNNMQQILLNLPEGEFVNTIFSFNQPIDSIIVLDKDNVPVAIGPYPVPEPRLTAE